MLPALFLVPVSLTRADEPVNRYCPVMPGTLARQEYHADWNGRRIFLCCERCVERFRRDPEYYAHILDVQQAAGGFIADPAGSPGGFRAAWFFGQFHPVAVHFPIAFAWGALLSETLVLLAGMPRWRMITRFLLDAGSFSAVVGVVLGLASAHGVDFGGAAHTLTLHRLFGLSGGALLVLAAAMREIAVRRPSGAAEAASSVLLAAAAAFLSIAAWHGGVLAHGAGHIAF